METCQISAALFSFILLHNKINYSFDEGGGGILYSLKKYFHGQNYTFEGCLKDKV